MIGGVLELNWKNPRHWLVIIAFLGTAVAARWRSFLGMLLFVVLLFGAGLGVGWALWGAP